MSKQVLWDCINVYTVAVGTEREKKERKLLDQAIDAALGDMSDDKLREAAESLIDNWLAQEPDCTIAAISGDLRRLTVALAEATLGAALPRTKDFHPDDRATDG